MGSIKRRLEKLEVAREPPGGWWTPEHEAERARRFAQLYRMLGVEEPPPAKLGRGPEELCALVAKWREKNITRKETQ
jgi:hypothetical protein